MSKNQKNCYIKDCKDEPKFVCNCENKPILICQNHMIDHWKLKGNHHTDKIYTEIHEETRKAAIKQFYELKSDIKQFKSKIIQEELTLINEIQKVAHKALKDLKAQENKLNEYILKAINLKDIDNSKQSSFIESFLKCSPNDLPKTKFIISLEFRINHISSDDIRKIFKLGDLSEQIIYLDNSLYEIKYIWCSSIELNIFNAITLKEDKINLQLPAGQNLEQYGAKCLLPDGSLFYDNGSITIIIDPKYHIKILPNPSPKSQLACAVYKDKEIYLIGGNHYNSSKFSLSNNKWTNLVKMPISLGNYSFGASFKNYILIVSLNSDKIFFYDTEIDSYSEILLPNLSTLTFKALFLENETVYLIEFSKNIYRSTDNFQEWVNIGSSSILAGNAPIISTPVVYNQKVYFVNYCGIYLFDLKQKNIEIIKIIA